MLTFLSLFILFGVGGKEFQDKYDYCQKIEFKDQYCSLQKKLYLSSKK